MGCSTLWAMKRMARMSGATAHTLAIGSTWSTSSGTAAGSVAAASSRTNARSGAHRDAVEDRARCCMRGAYREAPRMLWPRLAPALAAREGEVLASDVARARQVL